MGIANIFREATGRVAIADGLVTGGPTTTGVHFAGGAPLVVLRR
jgi:hypothetical protein